MNTKNQPIHELRLGHIKAALWHNEAAGGPRYNVTFSRLYFDNGQWRRTESYRRDDLLLLAKVADLAHSWICQQAQEPNAAHGTVTSDQAS